MLLDYATLRVIWWLLLGALLIGFAVMDGFDLGIGMLLHRVAKNNNERRVVLNAIGPIWEGNQIWLVLGAGAIFAAWPTLYAVAFSGFYFAMLLALLGLILRPVGFKYRSKIDNTPWRAVWDVVLFIAGFVPTLIFGVALGNVLQGVPFHFDETIRDFYTGNLFGLLNPFALLCGLVSIAMLIMHGGCFLCIKTTDLIQKRAANYARIGAAAFILFFALAGIWIAYGIHGYVLTSTLAHDGPSNPLYKQVTTQTGAWLNNYHLYPWTILAPLLAFCGALVTTILITFRHYKCAWLSSALSIAGTIATIGASMFPFILPSSTNPSMSLMVWDTSSSQLTLTIMLAATAIFLPIIIFYTSWVYYILRGKVTNDYVQQNQHNVY